ncbi:FtsX-like permease family protein [Cohnella sp. AR92]|uniref:FtsX-like permease family protein n=1 Tax=Cohnella sp. AR92 TaxID=648716 RepID=UPI000F8F44AA|nr:FtsX-like permease family protein [Cohnella sp. AR92]RUS47301.1 ABC transporter permease [Cohnella sp. AR92]
MKLGWQEMKRSKTKFLILGSILFLVSFLAFIVEGLANGLSQDNSALVKNLPNGHFYMSEEADRTYSFSSIKPQAQADALNAHPDAIALSIQMGFLIDASGKQRSFALAATEGAGLLPSVKRGEVVLDRSMEKEGIQVGDRLSNDNYGGALTVVGFADSQKFSHASVAFLQAEDYKEITGRSGMQLLFLPGSDAPALPGLVSFSKNGFLKTIPSYNAEQLTLNMIIGFLAAISGLLFGIFFYMMNVQKMGLYGILKAIGVRTGALFRMMWTQMAVITVAALLLSAALSLLFGAFAPEGMPYLLTADRVARLSVLFLIIGFAGSALSGIQIKKAAPLQAIQQGEM